MLKLSEIIKNLESFVEQCEISKAVVILDDDKKWLEVVKNKCLGENETLTTISNIDEFRSFAHCTDICKLYIDINVENHSGIKLARDMNLKARTQELFFVSDSQPQSQEMSEILELGGKFLLKKDVLKTVIFPEGVVNGHRNKCKHS